MAVPGQAKIYMLPLFKKIERGLEAHTFTYTYTENRDREIIPLLQYFLILIFCVLLGFPTMLGQMSKRYICVWFYHLINKNNLQI